MMNDPAFVLRRAETVRNRGNPGIRTTVSAWSGRSKPR